MSDQPNAPTSSVFRAFVVIASKGRCREVHILLDFLAKQTALPHYTVIVGTQESDIAGLDNHPYFAAGNGCAILSPTSGSSIQRNCGLEYLKQKGLLNQDKGRFFCAFFDDDYRPADDWLEQVGKRFLRNDLAGLTGAVLADGAKSGGISEQDAVAIIAGTQPGQANWAQGEAERIVGSVYGCNMAFIDKVVETVRFDENLPLYAWQEDRDYTTQAKRVAPVIFFPHAKGVHLGSQTGGRKRGLRFGYSQIANPFYLMKKGTMTPKMGWKFIFRALASNALNTVRRNVKEDYKGRLLGNLLAVADMILWRSHPNRILSLKA